VLRRAVELGINFIDTADAYGPEVDERLILEENVAAAAIHLSAAELRSQPPPSAL
jgi:aryl-alcohol dehydrogenase-like predicted oxidoreductase